MGRFIILVFAFPLLMSGIASAANADMSLPHEVMAQDEAIVLEPLTPWNIDFGETRCRLSRLFGTSESRHILFFDQTAPNEKFGLTFAGPEAERFSRSARIQIGMRRDAPMRSMEMSGRGDIEGIGAALIFTSIAADTLAEETSDEDNEPSEGRDQLTFAGINLDDAELIDRLVVARGKKVLSVETGNMKDPFQALNLCTRDFLPRWGLDPDKHESYTPPNWTNVKLIAQRVQRSYPSSALRNGEDGIFRMRVIIEKDGSVSDCQIDNATVTEHLVSPACDEMRHADFEPARDKYGQPMRSFYATNITYVTN